MKESMSEMSAELMKITQDVLRNAHIGEDEREVLLLFYDEKNKVRRDSIPKFQILGTLCDGKIEDAWFSIMMRAEQALLNLRNAGWIEVSQLSGSALMVRDMVGPAVETYKLTATGLEKLQEAHPSIALKLRGWIAVMPPWLVLSGSIAGGVGAAWKVIELLLPLIRR
jgi:hypothetical protein